METETALVADPKNGIWECETCGKVFDAETEGGADGGDDGSASPMCGKCEAERYERLC